MLSIPDQLKQPLVDLLLSIADDKLVMGHRNSDWTGLGPILEEDIAFSHLAQDDIAHAQALYEHVGPLTGRRADDLAFGRSPAEFRCASMVELPDDFDFALAVARQWMCSRFNRVRLQRLGESTDRSLAALASRLAAEEELHVQHADSWITRLATGTDESKHKLQSALDRLAPHASMLWEMVEGQQGLTDSGLYAGCGPELFRTWREALVRTARQLGLRLEVQPPPADQRGGRRGEHSGHLNPLLDEMAEVWRLEPGAAW